MGWIEREIQTSDQADGGARGAATPRPAVPAPPAGGVPRLGPIGCFPVASLCICRFSIARRIELKLPGILGMGWTVISPSRTMSTVQTLESILSLEHFKVLCRMPCGVGKFRVEGREVNAQLLCLCMKQTGGSSACCFSGAAAAAAPTGTRAAAGTQGQGTVAPSTSAGERDAAAGQQPAETQQVRSGAGSREDRDSRMIRPLGPNGSFRGCMSKTLQQEGV